jgi:hypothetical protein
MKENYFFCFIKKDYFCRIISTPLGSVRCTYKLVIDKLKKLKLLKPIKNINMKIKTIIVFVLFTIYIYSTQIVYCQDNKSIPIKIIRDKTLITVKVGNITIHDILLDTGFDFDGIIIYNPEYRDSINLSNAYSVSLGGAGSGDNQNALMIDSASFFVGNYQLNNQRIIVLLSDIYKGFPSNGIIGYSLFGNYAVEIDYDKNILVLHDFDIFKPDSGFVSIPIYFKDDRRIPWIDVSVVIENEDPINISAYIDFADRDPMVLLERQTMKFSLPKTTENKIIGTGLSGDIYGSKGKISKLIIGDYHLNNVLVSIASAEVRSKQKNADAVIGCGALNRFNLVFDFKNKYLYLKPNKSFSNNF